MVFMDRSRKAEDYPWLPWKVRIFLVGAVVAVAGMAMESRVLVGISIGILAFGFGLRFLPGGTGVAPGEEEWEDEREWEDEDEEALYDDEEWDDDEWDDDEEWDR